MVIIKLIILLSIFFICTLIGILMSKKYVNRVNNLKEIKSALNMFETKIKYTYEPIPEIFLDISKNIRDNIADIFLKASKKMESSTAGDSWIYAIENSNIEITKEDKNILKEMSKLLGKTSIEGQLGEIKLTKSFLDKQIEIAEQEKNKNEKVCRTLGITMGLVIVIVLI